MGKREKPWKINLEFFALLVVGIILFSLFLKAVNIIQKSIFDGYSRITLVLEKEESRGETLVFSLAPKEGSTSLLVIPSNTNVQVPKNFGAYQLGNVYKLGNLSPTSGRGGELLRQTTQNFIGAPVDGWMVLNSKFQIPNSKFQNNNLRILVKESLSLGNMVGLLKNREIDTNLTILDILRIWYQARQVGFDKIEAVNLQDLNLLERTHLLDGTEIFEADLKGLDQVSSSLFNDSRALKERITIEVVNGTDVTGFGSNVARIITNMGAEVLSVKNSPEKIANSSIIVSRESYTAHKISKTLRFPLVRKKNGQETSDILILLGED